jgi:tetratricopeptide (TPR) repeat protein
MRLTKTKVIVYSPQTQQIWCLAPFLAFGGKQMMNIQRKQRQRRSCTRAAFVLAFCVLSGCDLSDNGPGLREVERKDGNFIERQEQSKQQEELIHETMDRANSWFQKGQMDNAIATYNQAIRINSDRNSNKALYALAYMGRANAYHAKGQLDKALADYTTAILVALKTGRRENTSSLALIYRNIVAEALAARGNVYWAKDDLDSAIADLTNAIELNPKQAYAYRLRGSVFYHKNEFAKGIADLTEAIRLDPKDADAYLRRGALYLTNGHIDKAIANCSRAIQLNPDCAEAYCLRCLAYTISNRFGEAHADLTMAKMLGYED